ncbi:hypothetical protein [Paenibacillus glufosinatiresistens]|uniref:hypothetical protein n=1 Tax=Paenibacillus glufosinatiresistens TaxID=3070657 RepID=UPI00286DF38E|nr:hypothetical protein [Paenibacillus sp. YX.27]
MKLLKKLSIIYVPPILLCLFHFLALAGFIVIFGMLRLSEYNTIYTWFFMAFFIIITQVLFLIKWYLPLFKMNTLKLLNPFIYYLKIGLSIYAFALVMSLTLWIVGNIILELTGPAIVGSIGSVYFSICFVVFLITTKFYEKNSKNAKTF